VKRRGGRKKIAKIVNSDGDVHIEADVAELLVLEMGLDSKR
jgi:hypothetical protein